MDPQEVQKRIKAVSKLLLSDSISHDTFVQVQTLIKGINAPLDKALNDVSHALSFFEKISNDEIIELTAEYLPEGTEEQKKKKKALLFLIRNWKQLRSEVKRVENELKDNEKSQNQQRNLKSYGRIVAGAKGPVGIVTIAAVVIVGFLLVARPKGQATPSSQKSSISSESNKSTKIQIILYNGKQLPLSQLYVGHGPDCDSPHYHATTGSVTATDGTKIPDPENCGFGKLKDVNVLEVDVNISPTP